MSKKIISLILCLVLTLGLAACGGSDDKDTGKKTENKPGSSASTEVRDLGGRTIRFLANWGEPVKGNSDRENVYWAKKTEVQDKYNVKYEHIYLSDATVWNTFINSILSGDPMADIVSYKYNPFQAMRQGLFYDLSSLKEFDFSEDKWFKAVNEMGKVGDKQYLMFSNKFVALNLIFYNKDTFDQYKLEDLYTLQKEGKLTVDKLVSIATELSKATGEPSMRADLNTSRAHELFARSAGAATVGRKPGTLEFTATLNTENYVNSFVKAQNLIKDGVLSDGLDSSSWTYSRELFASGKLPILLDSENIVYAFENSDFNVGMCVMPAADGSMLTTANQIAWCAIPYNVKNANDVALIWNQMTDVTFDVDYKLRFQDVVTEEAMELIETLSKIQTTENIGIDYGFTVSVADDGVMNQMITGALSPAQAIQQVEPLYTAAIQSYVD